MAAAGVRVRTPPPKQQRHGGNARLDKERSSVFADVVATYRDMDAERLWQMRRALDREITRRMHQELRDRIENVPDNLLPLLPSDDDDDDARLQGSDQELVAASVLVGALVHRGDRRGRNTILTVDDLNAYVPALLAHENFNAVVRDLCGMITLLNCDVVFATPVPTSHKFTMMLAEKKRSIAAIDACVSLVAAVDTAIKRKRGMQLDATADDLICHRSPFWVPVYD